MQLIWPAIPGVADDCAVYVKMDPGLPVHAGGTNVTAAHVVTVNPVGVPGCA